MKHALHIAIGLIVLAGSWVTPARAACPFDEFVELCVNNSSSVEELQDWLYEQGWKEEFFKNDSGVVRFNATGSTAEFGGQVVEFADVRVVNCRSEIPGLESKPVSGVYPVNLGLPPHQCGNLKELIVGVIPAGAISDQAEAKDKRAFEAIFATARERVQIGGGQVATDGSYSNFGLMKIILKEGR